ncbi:MAG: diacylglycerol kinase family protein, partial [Ruminococcus sp.]|nr:diacylglycerol kinase family protein [Ruminococcus sp.]
MSIKNKLLSFIKSFKFAFNGIISTIKSERNMRIHLCAAFYVLVFMRFYELSVAEEAVVFLTIGFVISLEIVNTAVESVVNLCAPEYHYLAKKAKDASAGAVLISAIVSVSVGIKIFWDIPTFKQIYFYFTNHLLAPIGLIISLFLWIFFIFALYSNK